MTDPVTPPLPVKRTSLTNAAVRYLLDGHDETIAFSTGNDAAKFWEFLRRLEAPLDDLRAENQRLKEQVETLVEERDALLLDRHQPDRLSPCGHYRVFAMPCVHEDGTETPSCMQCDRDALSLQMSQIQALASEMRDQASLEDIPMATVLHEWADVLDPEGATKGADQP